MLIIKAQDNVTPSFIKIINIMNLAKISTPILNPADFHFLNPDMEIWDSLWDKNILGLDSS